MAGSQGIEGAVRESILKAPETILEDRDVMRALVGANERAMGDNIVDLRRVAMDRLEERLVRLEDTHQSVVATAYINLAGTQSVHRAVLSLLDAGNFAELLAALEHEVSAALRVDAIRLIVEAPDPARGGDLEAAFPILAFEPPGAGVAALRAAGLRPDRAVTLRETPSVATYPDGDGDVRSEALIRLDLGPHRHPAMLCLGSMDPAQFRAGQATDLLAFLGGVLERLLGRWLQ